ncbi:hypothetical protein HGI47_19645 [Novosphingobium sp. ERN07]|uniref:hypothetical protein n=1 Tax=Novosphingobium sp. ERN07 TaxID=2726187 RepID=UPI001456CD42|nr:hypothetical protein [Novosphingobium sp. ERN07]NLR73086.1 hypothetical protein [Novosphingobium sp. ERN07]
MTRAKVRGVWWNRPANGPSDPERLQAIADWCETLAPTEQGVGFRRAIEELDFGAGADPAMQKAARQWIALLADSGAFESAAIAMIPRSAIYTCGRLADCEFVAEIMLHDGSAAHSRFAQCLSMSLLAALMRALAVQLTETHVLAPN